MMFHAAQVLHGATADRLVGTGGVGPADRELFVEHAGRGCAGLLSSSANRSVSAEAVDQRWGACCDC